VRLAIRLMRAVKKFAKAVKLLKPVKKSMIVV
jgi:hypothetical protein